MGGRRWGWLVLALVFAGCSGSSHSSDVNDAVKRGRDLKTIDKIAKKLKAGGIDCRMLEHDPGQTFVAPKPLDWTDCFVSNGEGQEDEVFITLYRSARQTASYVTNVEPGLCTYDADVRGMLVIGQRFVVNVPGDKLGPKFAKALGIPAIKPTC